MKRANIIVWALFLMLLWSCGGSEGDKSTEAGGSGDAARSASKEEEVRSYKLSVEKDRAGNRTPCDTLSLQQHILDNFESGTFLIEFDKTYTYSLPRPAVYYYRERDNTQYIFAVLAKSKEGERFIEPKNIVGYESSFINLDSTKLGTAFFYLTLFECDKNGFFNKLWEAPVPVHGGFSSMVVKTWMPKRTKYIQLYYEDGIISGHREFNYFFINGIRNKPHLLQTYEGIVHRRAMANVNNDKYPDYYEYRFIDSSDFIRVRDSIPFYWDTTRTLYVTDVSRRWHREY